MIRKWEARAMFVLRIESRALAKGDSALFRRASRLFQIIKERILHA